MKSHQPKVSFIVSTFQGDKQLDLCLSCLEAISNSNFEIILADDGSELELIESVLAKHPKVIHVRQENCGFRLSRARNLGVAASLGKVLVFIDHDILVPPTFVDSVINGMREGWFLGGRRVKLDKEFSELLQSRSSRIFPSWFEIVYHAMLRKFSGTRYLFPMRQRTAHRASQNWRGMAGFLVCVYKSDFLAIDGFDSTYVSYGVEDWDFMARLSNNGILAGYLPRRATVLHVWHPESEDAPNSPNYQKLQRVLEENIVMPQIGYRSLIEQNE